MADVIKSHFFYSSACYDSLCSNLEQIIMNTSISQSLPPHTTPTGSTSVSCLRTAMGMRTLRTPHWSNNFECHVRFKWHFSEWKFKKLDIPGINFEQLRLIILTMILIPKNRNVNHTSGAASIMCTQCVHSTATHAKREFKYNSKRFLQIFKLDSCKRKNSWGCLLPRLFIATKYCCPPFVLLCRRNKSNVEY